MTVSRVGTYATAWHDDSRFLQRIIHGIWPLARLQLGAVRFKTMQKLNEYAIQQIFDDILNMNIGALYGSVPKDKCYVVTPYCE